MKYFNISLIAAAAIFAIINRIVIPFKNVFTDYGVILNTPDAYCMVRYAEMLPYTGLDYFANFPDGVAGLQQIVYPIIIKAFSIITGDYFITAAILPPLMFALTMPVVYIISKNLFNSTVAAMSVLLLCILPGEILTRTMLGAGDYHCLEILLLASIIATIILAVREKYISGKVLLSFISISLVALYYMSWMGAWISILIISAAFTVWVYLAIDNNYLKITITAVLVLVIPIAILTTKAYNYIFTVFGLADQNIIECYPLFFTAGQFDITTMMSYYGISFYVVLFGIGWLICRAIKYHQFNDILFSTFSIATFGITLIFRRFDYYFAVSVAIITAYMIYNLYQIVGRQHIARIVIIALAIISLPLAKQSIVVSGLNYGSPNQDWVSACQWLRDQNSANHEKAYYNGSKPDYGTLSWWNYGYWLMSIGHQAVLCHGGTADNGCSEILLSRSNDKALNDLSRLNMRYIVIDDDMLFNCNGLKTDYLTDTFMYKAYTEQVDNLKLVYQSSGIKVFSLTYMELTEATWLYLQAHPNIVYPNK